MRTFSKLMAVGRVTRDSVQNATQDGRSVVRFSIAVNHSIKQKDGSWKEEATFFNVDWWRRNTDSCQLRKGELVAVVGEVMVRSYTDRNGALQKSLSVRADEVTCFMAPQAKQQSSDPVIQNAAETFQGTVETFDDDPIPF